MCQAVALGWETISMSSQPPVRSSSFSDPSLREGVAGSAPGGTRSRIDRIGAFRRVTGTSVLRRRGPGCRPSSLARRLYCTIPPSPPGVVRIFCGVCSRSEMRSATSSVRPNGEGVNHPVRFHHSVAGAGPASDGSRTPAGPSSRTSTWSLMRVRDGFTSTRRAPPRRAASAHRAI